MQKLPADYYVAINQEGKYLSPRMLGSRRWLEATATKRAAGTCDTIEGVDKLRAKLEKGQAKNNTGWAMVEDDVAASRQHEIIIIKVTHTVV